MNHVRLIRYPGKSSPTEVESWSISVYKSFYLTCCILLVLVMPAACKTAQNSASSTIPVSSSMSTNNASVLPTVSSLPPMVLSVHLPADINGNWNDLDAIINFSTPMDKTAAAKALIVSPNIINVVLWENNNTTMVIHPLVNWSVLTRYTIKIAFQAQSVSGLQMQQDYSSQFEIEAMPASPVVLSTKPDNNEDGVDPTAVIQILFSEPMNTKATGQSLMIVPNTDLSQGFAILWDKDNRKLNFYFSQNMKPGEQYTITVTCQAISADGVYMKGSFAFAFYIMEC